jgi:flavin-dependent dehydrogenase
LTGEETVLHHVQSSTGPADCDRYDIVVIGGAFSGASFALLLKRWRPSARILVVEKAARFDRKVGEATVEVSACFLHRVLGLYEFLSREQLPKHGLRYWFADGPDCRLADMSEIGPYEVPRVPAFQLDRSLMDEHLLALAAAEGCEVERPATIAAVELGWPESTLSIEDAAGVTREVRARWVVDGSGRHAFLARRLRVQERVEEHPTAAVWARWHGVADVDGAGFAGADPRSPRMPQILAARRLGTNHFCDYGWWCWAIPLSDGDTSVGIVYDKRLFDLPGEGTRLERYHRFVTTWPGLRELLAEATMDAEDGRSYAHLPYRSTQYMGRGWALVGDAASFLDPYYSPGLDHCAITAFATAELVEADLAGRLDEAALDAGVARHNDVFVRSIRRWLEALYVDKYELMGDAELLGCAFLVDTAGYYLGVVSPIYRQIESMRNPIFGLEGRNATIAFYLMRALNRRLVTLARARRQLGTYGRRNAGWRLYARSFGLGRASVRPLLQGLAVWLRVEAGVLVRRFGRRLDLSAPAPLRSRGSEV